MLVTGVLERHSPLIERQGAGVARGLGLQSSGICLAPGTNVGARTRVRLRAWTHKRALCRLAGVRFGAKSGPQTSVSALPRCAKRRHSPIPVTPTATTQWHLRADAGAVDSINGGQFKHEKSRPIFA